MARPAKAKVDYFPHYVVSGKTLYILENSFGNDGYAFWFRLLEVLGDTEGHAYDCNSTGAFEYLCAKARVAEETAGQILDLLARLEAIDAELWEHRLIWVQNLVDNIADAYRKRKCPVPQRPSIPRRKPCSEGVSSAGNPAELQSADVSGAGNPQTKLNQTKGEYTPPLPPDPGTDENHTSEVDGSCVGEQPSPFALLLGEFTRYGLADQDCLHDYWAMIAEGKPRGSLSPKTVKRMMQRWEQHPSDIVLEGLEVHLRKYQDKGVEYTDAIITRLAKERASGVVQPIRQRGQRRRNQRPTGGGREEDPWDDLRLYKTHLPGGVGIGGVAGVGDLLGMPDDIRLYRALPPIEEKGGISRAGTA